MIKDICFYDKEMGEFVSWDGSTELNELKSFHGDPIDTRITIERAKNRYVPLYYDTDNRTYTPFVIVSHMNSAREYGFRLSIQPDENPKDSIIRYEFELIAGDQSEKNSEKIEVLLQKSRERGD